MNEYLEPMDIEDWLYPVDPTDPHGITPTTTDQELETLAAEVEKNARETDGIQLTGTLAYLRKIRENL